MSLKEQLQSIQEDIDERHKYIERFMKEIRLTRPFGAVIDVHKVDEYIKGEDFIQLIKRIEFLHEMLRKHGGDCLIVSPRWVRKNCIRKYVNRYNIRPIILMKSSLFGYVSFEWLDKDSEIEDFIDSFMELDYDENPYIMSLWEAMKYRSAEEAEDLMEDYEDMDDDEYEIHSIS